MKLKNAPLKFQKLKTYLRRPIKKREGTNSPHCKPSAEARKRVAVGHLNLLVSKIAKIAATPLIVVKLSRRGFLGSLG